MPWDPPQRRAIAARMKREGKSDEEIARFFREHGHGAEGEPSRRRRARRSALAERRS